MPRAKLASSRFVPLAPTSMRCSRPRFDCAPRSLLDADGLGVNRGAAAQRRASFLDFLAHFWRGGTEGQRFESSRVRCRRLQTAITWRTPMPDTTCHMSISLDGFVAGPGQSRENPLGKRGREVHSWHLGDERANDADATAEGWLMRPRGAYVMGRNMFGPIRGEWDEAWDGWWGPEPPYHAPVFVLTHHPREPIEMEGGTTFHFVTEGFDAAYAQARETAGDDGVDIAGGASTVRQALVAGVVDELTLDIAPVLLGRGVRLWDGLEGLEKDYDVEATSSPSGVTHLTFTRQH